MLDPIDLPTDQHEERQKLAARLADPALLDDALGIHLGDQEQGWPRTPWSGLAVPVGGPRVCGYVNVPRDRTLAVLSALERAHASSGGFPEVRVHRPASSHTLEAPTTRVEWGAEPACDPRARGVMLGYHPAGVEQFAAGVAAGVEGS
ncbi:DUF6302 family protein [Streptomyces sp. NPDC002454]|uniref:DUF6302 family protein n=1 Tax=Streptomyces sp. NPDC002490 TaxID=3154416 RepID=UPI0033262206